MKYLFIGSLILLALAGLSCDKKAVPPPESPDYTTALQIISGNNQTAAAGVSLADSLKVRILNENGVPVPDIVVAFSQITDEQGGRLIPRTTDSTDANGYAALAYIPDTLVGLDSIRALASGIDDSVVTFAVTVVAGAVDRLTRVAPLTTPLFGTAGEALADTFVVRVTDRYSNPVADEPVLFRTYDRCLVVTDSTAGDPYERDSALTRSDAEGLARAVWHLSVNPVPGFGYPNSFNMKVFTQYDDSVEFAAASNDPGTLEYYYDIRPVFVENCFLCHPSALNNYGMDFYYTTVKEGVVEPGDSLNSLILERAVPAHQVNNINAIEEDKVFLWVVADSAAPGSSGLNNYADNMKAIIDLKCLACHGASPAGNDYPMTTHAEIRTKVSNGQDMAIAGDSASLMLQSILPGGNMRVYLSPDSTLLADSLVRWVVEDSLRQY